jgi:hypothetical protein
LQSSINESRIKINKYNGGVIIRAGEWPELGWIKDMPYPELYLKVNKALKPIRAPEIGSLGMALLQEKFALMRALRLNGYLVLMWIYLR